VMSVKYTLPLIFSSNSRCYGVGSDTATTAATKIMIDVH
jgi:hypothetical protein